MNKEEHSLPAMKNLEDIVERIDQYISEKDKIREEALKSSRDIIICCRKAIQRLHQDQLPEAETFIQQASAKLVQLYDFTKPYPDLFHAGFVENAAQELVEAHCLYNIMKGEDLPDPDKIQTTYSAYLLGLCDVVGELRRGALDFMLEGNAAKANEYLHHMDRIYDAIMSFDYPSALVPIKKKQDMVRSLIEKTRGELVVANCERRIHEKTHEFHGLLDRVNGEKKNGEKKTSETEEEDIDIDKVW
jgi:translin